MHGSTSVSDWVIAHELAHQWFGNSAALEDWGDIWLNEGFATYLHYIYLADKGPTSMDTYMARARTSVIRARVPAPKKVSAAQLFDFNAVYLREP